MGGCASKPKDLHTQDATAPVEKPDNPAKPGVEAAPQPQESSNEGEVKREEAEAEVKKEEAPLVDLSEPAPEAPKVEEVVAETKAATVEAVQEDAKPSEPVQDSAKTTEFKVDAVEEKKEPKDEEKKKVAAEVAAEAPKPMEPEKEVDAAKPEEKK